MARRKRTYQISSEGHVFIDVEVKTSDDPTGTGPTFRVTPRLSTDSTTNQVGGDQTGTWESVYDATTSLVTARTTTLGDSGAALELAAGEYTLWIEWTVGSENPVEPVGTLLVN